MKEETTKVHRGTFKKGHKKAKKVEINKLKKAKKHLGELWDDQSSQMDIRKKKRLKKVR